METCYLTEINRNHWVTICSMLILEYWVQPQKAAKDHTKYGWFSGHNLLHLGVPKKGIKEFVGGCESYRVQTAPYNSELCKIYNFETNLIHINTSSLLHIFGYQINSTPNSRANFLPKQVTAHLEHRFQYNHLLCYGYHSLKFN